MRVLLDTSFLLPSVGVQVAGTGVGGSPDFEVRT